MDLKFDQKSYDIPLTIDGNNEADFDFITDTVDELMQRLFIRLKTYPRDLFWNTEYGLDYLNKVFGINRPKSSVDAILKLEIMKEPMVEKLVSFKSQIESYSYSCQFSVKAKYEETVSTFYILTDENGVSLTNELGMVLTTRI